MSETWKIIYMDEPFHVISQGEFDGHGYYKITFNDLTYGYISKNAWDNKKTDELLMLVAQMLNDAHDIALRVEKE